MVDPTQRLQRKQSRYLRADDLRGPLTLTVERVGFAEFSGTEKPVVYWRGSAKPLILNKTNTEALIRGLGPESDDWRGKSVRLTSTTVEFDGQQVPSILAEAIHGQLPKGLADELDDDIDDIGRDLSPTSSRTRR